MHLARENNSLRLRVNLLERAVLLRVLDAIARDYRAGPDGLDTKVAAAWYSTRGCKTAGMSAEETRDWVRTLHDYKSANLALLQDWTAQLSAASGATATLQLKLEHAHTLLTALNDYRLAQAARHDIGQAEMELRLDRALKQLKPEQQTALLEMDLVGYFIEILLQVIAPEAANWMET
jgi:hypothetical protein